MVAEKTTNKNRRISLIVLCALLAVLFSVSVPAATTAKIGKKSFSSVQKAFASAKNGQTITLMKNATVTGSAKPILSGKKKVVINLNKHTLRIKGTTDVNKSLIFSNCKNITIKNGTIAGNLNFIGSSTNNLISNVKITGSGKTPTDNKLDPTLGGGGLNYTANGKLTLKKATIENITVNGAMGGKPKLIIESGNYSFVCIENGGEATINGGKFTFLSESSTRDPFGYNTIFDIRGGSKLTVNNGTFKSKAKVVSLGGGQCIIKKGTFTSTGEYKSPVVEVSFGTLKISGGTFSASNHERYNDSNDLYFGGEAVISIGGNSSGYVKNCTLINKNATDKSRLFYTYGNNNKVTMSNTKLIIA